MTFTPGESVMLVVPALMMATPLTLSARIRPLVRNA